MKKRFLITGVSSGIGRETTKRLVNEGYEVLGIARRKKLLKELNEELKSKKFKYLAGDITSQKFRERLFMSVKKLRFVPDVVILNAAVFGNDFNESGIDTDYTREMFEVNFFANLELVNNLVKVAKKKITFVFVGSSSAFKGSGSEGIGYAASKSALSSMVDSLKLRYKGSHDFRIIHFGPIATEMVPFKKKTLFVKSVNNAVNALINTIDKGGYIHYYPAYLFLALRIAKVLPSSLYLRILSIIDFIHKKYKR